jgi:hypothetical protein
VRGRVEVLAYPAVFAYPGQGSVSRLEGAAGINALRVKAWGERRIGRQVHHGTRRVRGIVKKQVSAE